MVPKLFDPRAPGDDTPTVRSLVGLYLAHCTAHDVLCPSSLHERRTILGDFCETYGDWPVDRLKAYHLDDWINAHPTWKAPGTRQLFAAYVKALFGWSLQWDRIDRNPFARCRYKGSERRPAIPDPVLERIIAAATPPFAVALKFLRLTGCRVGELVAAKWGDVDLDVGAWRIENHKTRRKTGKPKVVGLSAGAESLLRTIALAGTADTCAGPVLDAGVVSPQLMSADARVFLNGHGRPWTTSALRGHWMRVTHKLHVTGVGLHSIRHTAATAMIRGGAPIKLVAQQLGHASVKTTEMFYVDVSDDVEGLRRAAELGRPRP